jgi:hypothetical protein
METMRAVATGLAVAVLISTLAFLPKAIADYVKGPADEEVLRLPLLIDSNRAEGCLAKQLVNAINRSIEAVTVVPNSQHSPNSSELGLFIIGLENDQVIELNAIKLFDHLTNDRNFYGLYLDLRF